MSKAETMRPIEYTKMCHKEAQIMRGNSEKSLLFLNISKIK